MSDLKAQEEVHGISTTHEEEPRVIAGYGETAKREGATTKEVHSVSLPRPFLGLLIISSLTYSYRSRPSCTLPWKRQKSRDGARNQFIFTVCSFYRHEPPEQLLPPSDELC